MDIELEKFIDKDDVKLLKKIEYATNTHDYDIALKLTESRLAQHIDLSKPSGRLLKGTLAGWLIDIGIESWQEKIIRKGLSILELEEKVLRENASPASYDYNIGNGYSGLFSIRKHKTDFKLRPGEIDDIIRSKSHYWRALRSLKDIDDDWSHQLEVNLGNCLLNCNRVSEAIVYYDNVISKSPTFPQANASRADALLQLNQLSDTYTLNMLAQAMEGYAIAISSPDATPYHRNIWHGRSEALKQILLDDGYDIKQKEHDLAETESEFNQHTIYRKFCIDNHLCLSEHSIYCGCIGARRDDLIIPKTIVAIGGDFVPRMEFILNRLKSEFTFARLMYYQSVGLPESEWELYEDEMHLTQLYENEFLGPRAEMLRLSLRNCFAILDKIAMSICEMFKLAEPKDVLYFESFWRPRWDRINQIDNPALVALYALATDLNSKNGDWPEFKNWRNAIEHKVLCVLQNEIKDSDPYSVIHKEAGDLVIPLSIFHKRVLFLLRLTRSAIFSFVFCVRYEGAKLSEGNPSKAIILGGRKEID